MLFQAVKMEREQRIEAPLHIQFIMGIKNAMPVDREVLAFYVQTLRRLSPRATWTGAGIGRDQITMARWSLELGGHCRTGLEDNVRLDRDTLAPSNAALVQAVARLCEAHDTPRGHRRASARIAVLASFICRCDVLIPIICHHCRQRALQRVVESTCSRDPGCTWHAKTG